MTALWWVALAWARPSADLADLQRTLERLHPAPYRYCSREDFREAFARERDRLDALEEPTELEIGRALHAALATLGDAHLAVSLPMMSPESATPISLLPLLPRRLEGQVFLDAGPDGALLAVQDQPIEAIYAELLGLVSADGRDPAAALRRLEHDFPRYYALRYGFSPSYEVQLLRAGEVVRASLPGTDRAGMAELRRGRRAPAWSGQGALRLEATARGTAVLRVPTFGEADSEGFRRRVDALMSALDPNAPLLIDLRGNEGGLRTNGMALLDHLLAAPYTEWTGARVARRALPPRLARRLSWPFGDDRLGPTFQREGGVWWEEGDPLASRWARPRGAHLGPLALLVDGRTGSAANGVVLVLERARPEALVVGEPLGGACDRHVGELPAVWTGRSTGVKVLFSLIEAEHVAPDRCVPGAGLTPDLAVHPTAADWHAGTDPWEEAAERGLSAQRR